MFHGPCTSFELRMHVAIQHLAHAKLMAAKEQGVYYAQVTLTQCRKPRLSIQKHNIHRHKYLSMLGKKKN